MACPQRRLALLSATPDSIPWHQWCRCELCRQNASRKVQSGFPKRTHDKAKLKAGFLLHQKRIGFKSNVIAPQSQRCPQLSSGQRARNITVINAWINAPLIGIDQRRKRRSTLSRPRYGRGLLTRFLIRAGQRRMGKNMLLHGRFQGCHCRPVQAGENGIKCISLWT